MPGASWFPGAELNYTENALRRRDDHPALLFKSEGGTVGTMSYAELYRETARVAAGLRRLGFGSRISMPLPVAACMPAPGQGTVAIEIREGDDTVARLVATFDDPAAGAALEAERTLVAALGGGCQTPIGALASPLDEDTLELVAVVVALDGSRIVRGAARGPRREASVIGVRVAAQLIAGGANEILTDARSQPSTVISRQSAAMTDE